MVTIDNLVIGKGQLITIEFTDKHGEINGPPFEGYILSITSNEKGDDVITEVEMVEQETDDVITITLV